MRDEILDADFFDENPYDWSEVKSVDMVEIKNYAFEQQAQMAKALLDAEGIPNFLKNANMASIYSGMSIGLGGVGLMVLRKDVSRVLDTLAADDEYIEVNEDMLTEAILRDMELEAHEAEQEVSQPFNFNHFLILILVIVVFCLGVWLLYFLFFS